MKCRKLLKLLKSKGWYVVRQTGSHIIMNHNEEKYKLIVPFHASKEMKKGTLMNILKKANIRTNKR